MANRTGTHADSLAFSTEEKQQTVASPSQGTRRRKVKGCAGKRVDLSSMLLAVRQHLFQVFRVATSSPATRRIFAYLAFARARAAGSASSGGSATQVRTYCNRLFPHSRGTRRNTLP